MAPRAKQNRISSDNMQDLVIAALTTDYVPSLARPDQAADADAFDKVMRLVGSKKRAWRGSRVAA